MYGGFQPDPKLNQNFLQNQWSMGIDASVASKNYVNDLRGLPYAPAMNTAISPWNLPTHTPPRPDAQVSARRDLIVIYMITHLIGM